MAAVDPVSTFGPADFQAATGVSRETLARLETYAALLTKWSSAINLVAPSTLPELWHRHMLDSAQLLPLIPRRQDGAPPRILDMGSGAGFPGLVLALCGAGQTTLVESDRKKATFLRQVARETGVRVTVADVRLESLSGVAADVVTARALAPLDKLWAYAAPLRAPGATCLFLKGQGVEAELTALPRAVQDVVERLPSQSDPAGCVIRVGEPQP